MKKTSFFDKKYLKRTAFWAAVSILSIGLVAYLSYHIAAGFEKDVSTMFARRTTLRSTVTCDGYIFRQETPIAVSSYNSGSLYSALEDGEKVRSSDKVAEIYSGYSPDIGNQLAAIDRQISMLENCRTLSVAIGDTGTVDEGIFDTVVEMRRAAETGNLARESSYHSDLFLKMKKRSVLIGEISDFSARIAELEAQKESLRSGLGTLVETVVSPASGYYYSECDGYEAIFSSSKVDSLSLTALNELISTDPAPVEGTAGKLVTNHKWYLACPMTKEDASKIGGVGGEFRVTLQNNSETPLDMTVYSVSTAGDGALVVFECEAVKEGFDFTRSQSVTVITAETTGFKVPVSAVRIVDGVEGVYIIDEIKVGFRRIDVIDESGGFYLCREVTAEDEAAAAEPGETAGPEETVGPAETGAASETEKAEETKYIPWLRQNDLMITGGTGLSEGMTHLPPRK